MGIVNNLLIRLSENSKPKYDPEKELMWDRYYDSSSWFIIGHFEAEGHKLNYLYHQMVWPMPDGSLSMNSVVSVTDETTGFYRGEDKFYPLNQAEIARDHFAIKVPNGSIEGDLKNLHMTASMENVKMDIDLVLENDIIYNGGGGVFSLAVIDVHQYSKPKIKPSGTITIDGKEYKVSGEAWFDRQWQKMPGKKENTSKKSSNSSLGGASKDPVTDGTIHWYWMDLNMDCGDKLSLWCVEMSKITRAWATVLHADGTQEVVKVTPFSKYPAKKWLSPASGQNYPIEFTVNIPKLDTNLSVTPYPVKQEIASDHISKYEAASQVSGTYKGKAAKGFCYVELVGGFK